MTCVTLMRHAILQNYDRAQVSNTLLSATNSQNSPTQPPSQRGQLWAGLVPPAAVLDTVPSQDTLAALETFFPGAAGSALRSALAPPDLPLTSLSSGSPFASSMKSKEPQVTLALCDNCEEAPATLECQDCKHQHQHQAHPSTDFLFCHACFAVHIATKQSKHHLAQPYVPPKQQPHPIVLLMHALLAHMEALTTSEACLLTHLRNLSAVLRQMTYVTLPSVRTLVDAPAFVGFRVSVDSLVISSEMFLQALQEIRLSQWQKKLESMEYSTIDNLLAQCTSMQTVFTRTIQKFQPTFQSYSHVVRLFLPLNNLLNAQLTASAEFREYMSAVESSWAWGGSLLSLLTKPLERIPAYILVCKDIYVTVVTIVSVVDEEYNEVLQYTQRLAQKLYGDMIHVLLYCYNEAREEQQQRYLHNLQCSFLRGHSEMNVMGLVAVGRSIVKQGVLKRHLKLGSNGKVRRVTLHVLSDVLLGSSDVYEARPLPPPKIKKSVSFENGILKKSVADAYDAVQEEYAISHASVEVAYDLMSDALHLDFALSLARRSGTVCLPVPSFFNNTESCWMVVIAAQKFLYLCAESVAERDEWVCAVQAVLTTNTADSDMFRVKNQKSLVNILLGEINTRSGERVTAEPVGDTLPADWTEICRQNIACLQPNWWGLFDVLESIVRSAAEEEGVAQAQAQGQGQGAGGAADPTSPIAHLRHVIDLHSQEFTETLLSLCASPARRVDISSALAAGASSSSSSTHLIAVDWFFQRSEAMRDKPPSQHSALASSSGSGSGSGSGSSSSSGSSSGGETTPSAKKKSRWGGNSDSRPTVLLLCVLSNVILAVRVVPSVGGGGGSGGGSAQHFSVEYAFHIELRNLECMHYEWGHDNSRSNSGSGSTPTKPPAPGAAAAAGKGGEGNSSSSSSAILLRDTSMSAKFLSLLGQSSLSERILFAPTIETKTRWLRFLQDCIQMVKGGSEAGAADTSERLKMLKKALPRLRRVSTKSSASGIWTTE